MWQCRSAGIHLAGNRKVASSVLELSILLNVVFRQNAIVLGRKCFATCFLQLLVCNQFFLKARITLLCRNQLVNQEHDSKMTECVGEKANSKLKNRKAEANVQQNFSQHLIQK